MAIPQGRLSTELVEGAYREPENRKFYSLISYERGPIAIEDTSEGLLYQNWTMEWDADTGNFNLTGETTLVTTTVITVADVVSLSFTFDQNGRVTITYVTNVSSYLYWYDTALGSTVTADLGANVITPCIYLDDKRSMQSTASDMLLFYTKSDGGATYTLYMLRQRDRYLTEYVLQTLLPNPYIHNVGMTSELRIQVMIKGKVPILPYVPEPPPPVDPDPGNFTFESGDTGWIAEAGTDFSINQDNPETGLWNATLDTIASNYSRFVNTVFFPVIAGQEITIRMSTTGTVAAGLAFGYQYYDAGFQYMGRTTLTVNITASWDRQEWITIIPAGVTYIKLCIESNGITGSFYLDNFELTI